MKQRGGPQWAPSARFPVGSNNQPMFYLTKDKKLLKRSLSSLLNEHREIQNMFKPRKNSGVRGMPKCVHNRIKRLESIIEHKGKLIAKAIEEKLVETGDSYHIKIPSVPVLDIEERPKEWKVVHSKKTFGAE